MAEYSYRVTLDRLPLEENASGNSRVCFDVTNHDDIFFIIGMMTQREDFSHVDAQAFAVGLKLFTDVVMRNRNTPFFAAIAPHVGEMMKVIKKDLKK